MTFNIRYGTAPDGPNHWLLRQDRVLDTIRAESPHILAIQEGLAFQMTFLKEHLPEYLALGQHRDGGKRGEFSGLLVDEAVLEILDSGQFWLSATPETLGSRGWDAALPRTAVWARLRWRAVRNGEASAAHEFLVLGTHLDHRGKEARLQSALLIQRRMEGLANGIPVLLMGDFNVAPEDPPMQVFQEAGFQSAVLLHDSAAAGSGTFHSFRGHETGRQIDHIWVSPGWNIQVAEILRPRFDGRSPSDHDPVFARFGLAPH